MDALKDRPALMVGHALEHLELHPSTPEGTATVSPQHRQGDIKEIVRGDANPQPTSVLIPQGFADHPLKIGIGF